ncbi:MAG: hypothetical protein QNJ33_15105 [Crocosphaera sp.]|nr:hypothetical protein [Crocosphaera sp.]
MTQSFCLTSALGIVLIGSATTLNLTATLANAATFSAKAEVNGEEIISIGNQVTRIINNSGVSTAAAQVAHKDSDFKVTTAAGDAQATKQQERSLNLLLRLAKLFNEAGVDSEAERIASHFAFKASVKELVKPPIFPEILKEENKKISASTRALKDNRKDIEETANSLAEQTFFKRNNILAVIPKVSIQTSVDGDDEESKVMPMASALGINRDPLAILWDAGSLRSVEIDLSALTLTVETIGFGTSAAALYSSDGIFIDDTTDINKTEDDSEAESFFDLFVAITSFDDSSPTIDILDLDVFGNQVFDNMGNIGIDSVGEELKQQFKLIDENTFGFMSDYSFTVVLPDNLPQSSESVLFLRNFSSVATLGPSIPEPSSSLSLLALGMLCISSTFKCKLKSSESPKKESLKVG